MSTPPILDNKDSTAASVFQPAALLREARRQKGLAAAEMPSICVPFILSKAMNSFKFVAGTLFGERCSEPMAIVAARHL